MTLLYLFISFIVNVGFRVELFDGGFSCIVFYSNKHRLWRLKPLFVYWILLTCFAGTGCCFTCNSFCSLYRFRYAAYIITSIWWLRWR